MRTVSSLHEIGFREESISRSPTARPARSSVLEAIGLFTPYDGGPLDKTPFAAFLLNSAPCFTPILPGSVLGVIGIFVLHDGGPLGRTPFAAFLANSALCLTPISLGQVLVCRIVWLTAILPSSALNCLSRSFRKSLLGVLTQIPLLFRY